MTAVGAAAMTRESELEGGLRSLGLSLSPAQLAKLDAYVALLVKWNRTYNLTAIREPSRIITHHLLDALAVLPHLPEQRHIRLLDVGAGGGVPGIPIAIARPHWTVVMVDASHKKVAFLTQAAIELDLTSVKAVASRIEDLAPDAPFGIIIARAFADLRAFAQSSVAHLAPGGCLYAMKGVLPHDEIAALPANIEVAATPALFVPGLDAERHLIVMRPRGART